MMRVVIVDDYQVVRTALKVALEAYDVEIVGEAATGSDAIQLCRALQPDVVIMDLYMTDMDGITTFRQIRETCKSVKSILLTSSDELMAPQAKAAGFDVVLPKMGSAIARIGEVIQSLHKPIE